MRTIAIPETMRSPKVLSPSSVVGVPGLRDSKELLAVGLDGSSLWRTILENSCQLGDVTGSRIWLFESRAIVALDESGSQIHRTTLRLDKHERIGCVTAIDDGLLASVYREKEHPNHGREPRVIRLNSSSEEVWSTQLPVNAIEFEGCVRMGVDTAWQVEKSPPWKPSTWLPYGDDQLLTSGNRVLASFQEMPSSGIGCRYVLDMEDGKLLWKSKPSPISSASSPSDGTFLMGDQGYGAFKTTLFIDGAKEKQSWPTHGYDIVVDDEVISVQMANQSSVPQHIVRIGMDGSVDKLSDRLPGYYSSKPRLMSDGNVYFWRAGHIWKWNHQDGLSSVMEIALDKGAFASSLQFSESRIGFNVRPGYAKTDSQKRVFAILEC